MSKKNLARTAIEGGRANSNKWDRRNSHTEERNAAREYCKQAIRDPESVDEQGLIKKKSKVYKDFTDKLGPMYRWLRSQVGRPWSEVRSEVFQKFDIRTTAGRHILFDHLLRSVETDSSPPRWFWGYYRDLPQDPNVSHYKNDFWVDESGILKERQYISRRTRRGDGNLNFPWIAQWLKGRVVIKSGSKMYWCASNTKDGWSTEWKCEWMDRWSGLKYLFLTYESVYNPITMKSTYKPVWREPFWGKTKKIYARQDVEFSKKDYQIWKEIPSYYQDKILEYSPVG